MDFSSSLDSVNQLKLNLTDVDEFGEPIADVHPHLILTVKHLAILYCM